MRVDGIICYCLEMMGWLQEWKNAVVVSDCVFSFVCWRSGPLLSAPRLISHPNLTKDRSVHQPIITLAEPANLTTPIPSISSPLPPPIRSYPPPVQVFGEGGGGGCQTVPPSARGVEQSDSPLVNATLAPRPQRCSRVIRREWKVVMVVSLLSRERGRWDGGVSARRRG